jgi:hypothetical protein
VIESPADAVWPALSVQVTEKLEVPVRLGVPEMTPLVDNDRPVGGDPVDNDQA